MNKDQKHYEVGKSSDLQKKYGLYAENAPELHLDPSSVPEPLRPLIPLAEKFGVSDDIMRLDLISKTSPPELERLREAVWELDDPLDDWLAGPEADGPTFSAEYIAFSCMRMAVDESG